MSETHDPNASAPRVTEQAMINRIANKYEFVLSDAIRHTHPDDTQAKALEKVSLCVLVMQNGVCVIGQAAPVSAGNFVRMIGQRLAYENAVSQLWPLEGYALADRVARSERGENEGQPVPEDPHQAPSRPLDPQPARDPELLRDNPDPPDTQDATQQMGLSHGGKTPDAADAPAHDKDQPPPEQAGEISDRASPRVTRDNPKGDDAAEEAPAHAPGQDETKDEDKDQDKDQTKGRQSKKDAAAQRAAAQENTKDETKDEPKAVHQ